MSLQTRGATDKSHFALGDELKTKASPSSDLGTLLLRVGASHSVCWKFRGWGGLKGKASSLKPQTVNRILTTSTGVR